MKSSFYLVLMKVVITFACEFKISSEFLDACSFDSLVLVNPSTGFVIANENCGLEVDKENFFEQPFVFYPDAVDYAKYTLMMVDDDNPLSVDDDEYLHWLVTDIDGQSLKYGMGIYSGNTLAGKSITDSLLDFYHQFFLSAYVPPDPSQDTCVHRYSIYIYEQRFHPLEFPELEESRAAFNIFDFNGQVFPEGGICGPVASMKFKSRY